MKRYRVISEITISLSTVVEAKSPAEAKRIARSRPLVTIYENHPDESSEWVTSGELDGTPKNLSVEPEEDQ